MLTETTLVLSQAPDSLFAAANRCAWVLGLGRLPKGHDNQIAVRISVRFCPENCRLAWTDRSLVRASILANLALKFSLNPPMDLEFLVVIHNTYIYWYLQLTRYEQEVATPYLQILRNVCSYWLKTELSSGVKQTLVQFSELGINVLFLD